MYFQLNTKTYTNNSVIKVNAIGEGEEALLCKTDKVECCGTTPNRFGEFYYPSGVQVPIRKAGQAFYRNRGNQQIRLNQRPGAAVILTGVYRCEIPDSNDVIQKVFITLEQE